MCKKGVIPMNHERTPSSQHPQADNLARTAGAGMTRRQVLRAAVVGGMAAASYVPFPYVVTTAKAAPKTIKIGIWAGPDGQLIKSTVIEKFEKQYHAKVYVDEGITTEQLARLRASKNNPTHTVMFMDDIGVSLARQEELLAPLPEAQIPNLANVFPRYRFEDGYGVGIQVSTVALTYSTQAIQEAPASWEALWDPAHKGLVSVPSIASTNGLNVLVAAAAIETGKPF
jgi:putative spermidine/putrescine transport system substrate-binding protein